MIEGEEELGDSFDKLNVLLEYLTNFVLKPNRIRNCFNGTEISGKTSNKAINNMKFITKCQDCINK